MSNEQNNAEPIAYLTEDGERCVTSKTYNTARNDGGAIWSTMRPFCVPAYATPPAAAPAPAEPFGYFRVDALGWTDCAATDEGAIALYERPAAPAVPDTHISVQEAWEAAGGNPGIKASKADLIIALKTLDTVCDEADAAPAVPQGEPVAWRVSSKDEPELGFWLDEEGPGDDDMGLHYEPLYTATPSQEHAVNLSCRSTQARLAAQWGYVPAPSQPAVPQGEPVYQLARATGPVADAWIDVAKDVYDDAGFHPSDFKRRILYAAPSQPVTLTDEEIKRNWSGGACPPWGIKFARAILAALREKEQAK